MLLKIFANLILFAIFIFLVKGYKVFSIEVIATISIAGVVSAFVLIVMGAKKYAKEETTRIQKNINIKKENLRTDIEVKAAKRRRLDDNQEEEEYKRPDSDNTPKDEGLLKDAEKGEASAQNKLGWMYLKGEGVNQDYSSALYWFSKSAEKNDFIAQYNLGTMYDEGVLENHKKAFEWYQKSAEQGYDLAQTRLGDMFLEGVGVEQSDNYAFKWHNQSARQGNMLSQCFLAYMHSQGIGTFENEKKAFEWQEKSAKQGYSVAQYNLGVMYTKGDGVLKDLSKAKYWISKAYEGSDVETSKRAETFWSKYELWKY